MSEFVKMQVGSPVAQCIRVGLIIKTMLILLSVSLNKCVCVKKELVAHEIYFRTQDISIKFGPTTV